MQEGYVSQSLDHLIVCVWTEICFRVRITRPLPWKTRTMRCKLSVKWENNKRQSNCNWFSKSLQHPSRLFLKKPSRGPRTVGEILWGMNFFSHPKVFFLVGNRNRTWIVHSTYWIFSSQGPPYMPRMPLHLNWICHWIKEPDIPW